MSISTKDKVLVCGNWLYALICRHCHKPFYGIRCTAQYCSDRCRRKAFSPSTSSFRASVLQTKGPACERCGATPKRVFVHPDKECPEAVERAMVYCGKHHAEVTTTVEAKARRERWLLAKSQNP